MGTDETQPQFVFRQLGNVPSVPAFSERTLRHPTELATGEGFVAGMGADPSRNVETRLRARPMAAPLTRVRLIGRNVLRLLLGRARGQSR